MPNTDETTRRLMEEPDGLKGILQNVLGELAQLRERFDARDRETKPLGETLEAIRVDVQQLRKGQDQLGHDMNVLRKEMREGFGRMERKQDLLNNRLLGVEGDIVGLDQRVEAIENAKR